MSRPKRHHYVPQFYLRRFSINKKSIVCFNKRSKTLIPHAPIKGQCAIDNFYSWNDDVEPALGVIEGAAASIMRSVSETNELPSLDYLQRIELLNFISLQLARTKLSGDSSNNFTDKFGKIILEGNPEFANIDLSNYKIKTKYPAALPMQIALEASYLLENLGQALLINGSKMPFFCSDNPVTKYNSRKSHVVDLGVTGLDSSGLQIFCPIDETRAIYLFDKQSYRNPTNTGIRKIGIEDVAKINFTIFMSSDENIYLSDVMHGKYAYSAAESCDPFLPYVRDITVESIRNNKKDGKQGSLLHTYSRQAPIEAFFSFARFEPASEQNYIEVRSRKRPPIESISANSERYAFSAGEMDNKEHLKNGALKIAVNKITRL